MTLSTPKPLLSKLKSYQGGYVGGDVPCERCDKKDNYPYYRTFEEVSNFRGDDEVKGNLCHTCFDILKGAK